MLLFLTVCLISFLGSLHPGTVNLAVIQATLSQSRRAGLWLALGGSLPEIGYSGLAAGGLTLLPANLNLTHWLTYAAVPVLLGVGVASLRHKSAVMTDETVVSAPYPFWKGVALASINPQLLPFWSAVWLYLQSQMLVPVHGQSSVWAFASGTAVGAFGLLVAYVWLADRYRNRVLTLLSGRWINWLTGGLFIGMACWQVICLLLN
jgi:threonine/homoserine/homoserine lactone efflux protein